jgi:hypothetical protein
MDLDTSHNVGREVEGRPLQESDRVVDQVRILDNAYVFELQANCRMFIVAFGNLHLKCVNAPEWGLDEAAQRRIRLWTFESWGDAYAMIEATRRTARILWEGEGCEGFRARFKLPLSPHLRPDYVKDVRNALEHVESRIPRFVKRHTDGKLAGWVASNNPADSGLPGFLRFRYLNLESGECTVEDQDGRHSINLRELERAVRGLNLALPDSPGATHVVDVLPSESTVSGSKP